MRMTNRRLILIALSDAIEWNQGLLDGLPERDPHAEHVKKLIAGFRRVHEKMGAGKMTASEAMWDDIFKNTKPVSVSEITDMNRSTGSG